MTDVNGSEPVAYARCVTNPLKIWLRSGRMDSLVAASMPVISSLALAWKDMSVRGDKFLVVPAVCCFFFAVLAQIAANLINDYSDYRTGANVAIRENNERNVGITQRSLLIGGIAAFCCAVLFGLATIPFGGVKIIVTGLVLGAICLLYSVGPFPFSEWGLGDVAVIMTFGMSSVIFTYFLQTGGFSPQTLLLGFVFGMAINNILVANNYADYAEDKSVKKYTTVVLFGENFGRLLYISEGFFGAAALAVLYTLRGCWGVFAVLSIVLYLAMHLRASATFLRPGFDKLVGLAQAGMNVVLLGVLVPLAILF